MKAFEEGLCWALYNYMENDLIRFFEFVPYRTDTSRTYSPKLLAMLLQIGGYIDTVFKEMLDFDEFMEIEKSRSIIEIARQKDFDITVARQAFEEIYRLSSNFGGELEGKLTWTSPRKLYPFACFALGRSPRWWKDYNDVKHDWASELRKANMDNVLEALSGAFLLNVIHYPSLKLLWKLKEIVPVIRTSGLGISPVGIHMTNDEFEGTYDRSLKELKPFDHGYWVETQLFKYTHLKE